MQNEIETLTPSSPLRSHLTEEEINDFLGDMDLFLMDQVLKGTFHSLESVLDIGCGSGRNLLYFLQKGYRVCGIDVDKLQIDLMKHIVGSMPNSQSHQFIEASAESLPLPSDAMDLVICSRVLHHLPSTESYEQSCLEMYRVLKPGGILYLSMNSSINFQDHVIKKGDLGVFNDGTQGLFLNELMISFVEDLGFEKLMPHRTVHFDNLHAETTMILKKQ